MNKAFIFPGQGSQALSMGKDYFQKFSVAKKIFTRVDDALGYSLSDIIFNGPSDILNSTINTQPALMVTSIAILKVIEQETGKSIDQLCKYVAGHSLGEYTALCASDVIEIEDAARLLHLRGKSMQEASPKGEGAMAACIGVTLKDLEEMLGNIKEDSICEIANDNVTGQIVISGHESAIDRAIAALKDSGYRAIKLNVSAPFHSSLIEAAKNPMRLALEQVKFKTPKVPIIQNVSVIPETDTNIIKENLISQITSRVRWRETMDKFKELNVTELIEVGSGKVLSGLAKRSKLDFKISNFEIIEDLDAIS